MLNVLLSLKGITFTATSRYPFIHHYPFLFSLRFCTATSNSPSPSFAVSYLIHNFGFSLESASKASDTYRICFRTPEKPESVTRFFIDRGFSNSQINNMVRRAPWLLSCNPCKRVFPKFEFLHSKGVPSSKIVDLVSRFPGILNPSLKNNIVPTYELVYRFLQSDKYTVACLFGNSFFTGGHYLERNITLLRENGVSGSNIVRLLRSRCKVVFASVDILKAVGELKDMGFDPSKSSFAVALIAIKSMSQTSWKKKVDTFRKWGWSDEACLEAFRRYPHCMLASIDKINIVMNFWVNQMGWDASAVVRCPKIFGSSMEKTIIPRALVVHYLLANGLWKKGSSLLTPFLTSEKVFIETYVMCFKDTSEPLKLYQKKMSVQV